MKQSRKLRTTKGFSLIEVIIAFSVLTITIVGATRLLSSSIQNGQENVLRLQSTYLATEGIEAVKNIRDSYWLQNIKFDSETINLFGTNIYPEAGEKSVIIETNINASTPGTRGNPYTITPASTYNTRFYIADLPDGSKIFTHTPTNVESPFKREIVLSTEIDDNDLERSVIIVDSRVTYEVRGKEKTISMKSILTDWK